MKKIERSFFIESVELTEIQGRRYVPTALFYEDSQALFGQSAISKQKENKIVNVNFKIALGEYRTKFSKQENRLFETADGAEKALLN